MRASKPAIEEWAPGGCEEQRVSHQALCRPAGAVARIDNLGRLQHVERNAPEHSRSSALPWGRDLDATGRPLDGESQRARRLSPAAPAAQATERPSCFAAGRRPGETRLAQVLGVPDLEALGCSSGRDSDAPADNADPEPRTREMRSRCGRCGGESVRHKREASNQSRMGGLDSSPVRVPSRVSEEPEESPVKLPPRSDSFSANSPDDKFLRPSATLNGPVNDTYAILDGEDEEAAKPARAPAKPQPAMRAPTPDKPQNPIRQTTHPQRPKS